MQDIRPLIDKMTKGRCHPLRAILSLFRLRSGRHLFDYASEYVTGILAEGPASVFFKPTNSITFLKVVQCWN
jgi:hypothetical protein